MSRVFDTHPVQSEADMDKTTLGFWIYLMTDCVLFASLFATFAVLRSNTAGGPSGYELFSLSFVLLQTVILLTSSYTSAIMMWSLSRGVKKQVLMWLSITALLGAAFLSLELYEFHKLVSEDASWQRSAFLSSYFSLVGTHGLHIFIGILWALLLFWYIWRKGLSIRGKRRLGLFSLFWHFLDIVWICIFTFVYLWGAIG